LWSHIETTVVTGTGSPLPSRRPQCQNSKKVSTFLTIYCSEPHHNTKYNKANLVVNADCNQFEFWLQVDNWIDVSLLKGDRLEDLAVILIMRFLRQHEKENAPRAAHAANE
jgi:hypothetical protein